MTGTTRTIDTPSFVQQVDLSRPPEAVFEAVSTAAGVSGWWMPTTGSGAEGTELHLRFPPGPVLIRVDTVRPVSTVAWTVLVCDFEADWVGTQIVFTLRPGRDGGTTLEFRHQGLTPQLHCYDRCRQGWGHYLSSLRDYVETGAGRPGDRHGS
jgi:uncharacterized protein YndB with AHSA1/START domain